MIADIFSTRNFDHVSILQERLRCHSHPARRSGSDDVSRLQSDDFREIGDKARHIEHHVAEECSLALFAVDQHLKLARVQIGQFV